MKRLLRVEAPYFIAGAIWDGRNCIKAAPIIGWMVGKEPEYVRNYLIRKNWKYEWLT